MVAYGFCNWIDWFNPRFEIATLLLFITFTCRVEIENEEMKIQIEIDNKMGAVIRNSSFFGLR